MKPAQTNSAAFETEGIRCAQLPEQIRRWNQTATAYPRDKTVAQVFEEIAALHPNLIALEMGEKRLNYSELNARSNRVARRLRTMGVGPEKLVGCFFERSIEMIVAFVAVLKAGGAFVPLDPSDPPERMDFMLGHAGLDLILTQKHAIERAFAGGREAVSIDTLETAETPQDATNLELESGPHNLAYVMYTSGSTGKPKGVMVENRAIVRLVRNTNFCHLGAEEVFLQFAPASFDASTLEIWAPLLNGGKLVVMPAGKASLADLGREIREHGVTVLWLTSGLFNLMVEQRLEDLRPIRQLLAGGDVLSPRHVRMVLENLPECRVINGYGPTENTTFTCCHAISREDCWRESIPIGKPISNTQVYILDGEMNPVQPGQAGELYAAGDGVARGYFNDPDATAEKFVPNPFAAEPAERMYRTGDLARWCDDGVIEFLGRIDNQVKIAGHRIEPGEIETVLRMNKDVSQVCVVSEASNNGSKRLIAYYVATAANGLSSSDLRQYLSGKLPHYMIPALFVPLASFPLSANGKIDRSALPTPPMKGDSDSRRITSNANQIEQTLTDLWKRILRVDAVGLDDNVFDLGGDSLMIIAIHSNLQKTLGIEIAVTDLFEFTTIRTLARHLGEQKPQSSSLSDAQQQGAKQREAFERQKRIRAGGTA